MQQQHGAKENAILNTHTSAKETDKENYLTESEQIPGTPFMLRRIEEKWFITCGEIRLTEWTQTWQEQIDKLETEKWAIIAKLIIHLNKLDRLAEAAGKQIDMMTVPDRITHNGL